MWVGEKTWMSIEKGSSDPPGIVSRLSAMGTEGHSACQLNLTISAC